MGLVTRRRDTNDERQVIVSLTLRGQALEVEADITALPLETDPGQILQRSTQTS